jgi:hypothetical protein
MLAKRRHKSKVPTSRYPSPLLFHHNQSPRHLPHLTLLLRATSLRARHPPHPRKHQQHLPSQHLRKLKRSMHEGRRALPLLSPIFQVSPGPNLLHPRNWSSKRRLLQRTSKTLPLLRPSPHHLPMYQQQKQPPMSKQRRKQTLPWPLRSSLQRRSPGLRWFVAMRHLQLRDLHSMARSSLTVLSCRRVLRSLMRCASTVFRVIECYHSLSPEGL